MGQACAKIGGIDEMKKDVADLKVAVDLLKTATGKIEEGQKMFEQTMVDLNAHKEQVQNKVRSVTEQVTQVRGAADNVQGKIQNIQKTVDDLKRQAGGMF